ncbi:MAG: aryl-sulfate sulfotransferase [Deltaproteobacteria bacterium]|nr:aryl-sulfate sulfotransferase [Deltaproteobacteria bacterium]
MLVPGRSHATVPTISVGTITNPYSPANTMMYSVPVTVGDYAADADHDGRVGFRIASGNCAVGGGWRFTEVHRFATSTTHTFTLYNFKPGQTYQYRAEVGPVGSANSTCGTLGTPSLPTDLGYLDLDYDGSGGLATDFVLVDTTDCGSSTQREYIIAVDANGQFISWYLDIAAIAGSGGNSLGGWRFQKGTGPTADRFLGILDRRYLYEWDWTGATRNVRDFGDVCASAAGDDGPCIHHDAFKLAATGTSYVLTSAISSEDPAGTGWDGVCNASDRFVNDGFDELDTSLSTTDSPDAMTDWGYDPDTDGGENEGESRACNSGYWDPYFVTRPLDWMHPNSVSAHKPGSDVLVDLSFKEWNQVIRVNASTNAVVWRMANGSTWSTLTLAINGGITGSAGFAGQHMVHDIDGFVQMFDNEGGPSGTSRVLRWQLSGGPPVTTATIVKSWELVNAGLGALVCPGQGSGVTVLGTSGNSVLALCNAERLVEELSDYDGDTSAEPPLIIQLATDPCTSAGGPDEHSEIRGWYRAFPVEQIGPF